MSSELCYDCFIQRCCFCGLVIFTSRVCVCPFCGCGDVITLPVTGDCRESFDYFESHGFLYLRECSEVLV